MNLINKYRTLGIIFLIVLLGFAIISSFVSIKEKKDVAFKLKMFFADMSQSVQYAINSNGSLSEWNLSEDDESVNISIVKSNILDSMRVSKDCLENKGSCFATSSYKNLSGKVAAIYPNRFPAVVLQNGIAVAFETVSSCKNFNETCILLHVDINGDDKPNVIGKDFFTFELLNSQSSQFRPYGASNYASVKNDTKYGCSKNATLPLYCSSLLFATNWRVEKNYPW